MPDEERAWQYLLRLVARRPRTFAELHHRLTQAGFEAPVVQAVIARAQDAGLVDDRLFARLFAQDRLFASPRSRKLLTRELIARGVAKELAQEAAAQTFPELSEEQLARQAFLGRLSLWRGLPPEVAARRAFSFLLRRGFEAELARRIVGEAFGQGRECE